MFKNKLNLNYVLSISVGLWLYFKINDININDLSDFEIKQHMEVMKSELDVITKRIINIK